VLVPVEVASEFRRLAGVDKRFSALTLPSWIEILPSPPASPELTAANLDLGKTAAIALCLSQSADALLVDESLGRDGGIPPRLIGVSPEEEEAAAAAQQQHQHNND